MRDLFFGPGFLAAASAPDLYERLAGVHAKVTAVVGSADLAVPVA